MSISESIREAAHIIIAMMGWETPDNPTPAAAVLIAASVILTVAVFASPLALLGLVKIGSVGLIAALGLDLLALWAFWMWLIHRSVWRPDPWL